jgi:hypothetical protein
MICGRHAASHGRQREPQKEGRFFEICGYPPAVTGDPLALSDGGRKPVTICYLCGEVLEGEVTRDHVPPKQVFPEDLRRRYDLNLVTLPAHKTCNASFQRDEVYFVQSIGPLATNTYAGKALLEDLGESFKYPEGVALSRKVVNEFQWRLNGLWLPPGLVVKSFDPDRVHRVVWKIVRGLFFLETRRFLPTHTLRNFEIYSKGGEPVSGPTIDRLRAAPGHTEHPAVFDYKCIEATSETGYRFHVWALLFWDALMWIVLFHDSVCDCDGCVGLRKTYRPPAETT